KLNKLWRPMHVFQDNVSYLEPWRTRVRGNDIVLDRGYEALGRASAPDENNLVAVLADIQSEYQASPISEHDTKVVIHIYQRILEFEHLTVDDLSQLEIPLLSSNRILLEPDACYLPDAPWFTTTIDQEAIQLVHRSVPPEFALALGARRLSTSV